MKFFFVLLQPIYPLRSWRLQTVAPQGQLGSHTCGQLCFNVSSLVGFQIMNKFQVAPFDQHLSYNGRDLVDNQATLGTLRIFPGTLIILQVGTASNEAWLETSFSVVWQRHGKELSVPFLNWKFA